MTSLANCVLHTQLQPVRRQALCPFCTAAFRLFGGIKLDQITGKDVSITFNDIAGIDQVKQEIVELVQFLKNPKRFLDLGARSPAGVLLVGPPGTGTDSCHTHLQASTALLPSQALLCVRLQTQSCRCASMQTLHAF